MTGSSGRRKNATSARRPRRDPAEGLDGLRLNPEAVGQLRTRLPGCLLSASIVVAPFVALLYDLDLALGITAVALLATAWLARGSQLIAPPELRPRLRIVALVNVALAVIAVAILAGRIVTGSA